MLLLLYFYLTLWYVHLILNFSTQGLYCPCDFPPQTLQFPNSHSSHSCCNEIYAFTLPSPTLPSCLVLSCLVLSCLVLSCLVLSWRDVTWRDVSCRVVSYHVVIHSCFLSFLVSLLYLLVVGLEGYCYTWSLLIKYTQSVGLIWTRDRSVAETSTWQHTTFTRDRQPCLRRNSNLQRPQTHALDRVATGTSFITSRFNNLA